MPHKPTAFKGRLYEHRARVTCPRGVPTDMLRHDRCWPRTGADASMMSHLSDPDMRRRIDRDKRTLEVVTLHESRFFDRAFTAARWESFGCTIEEVTP